MKGLRKRTWETKKGITTRWEFSYMQDGKQRKKTFRTKPSIQELAEITKTIPKNPFLKDFIEDYLKNHCALHCKLSTIETYEDYFKNNLTSLYFIKIKDLQRRHIEKLVISLKEKYAPKTIHNILIFVKGFLNYAVEEKIIIENPAKKVKAPPAVESPPKTFSKEEINYFFKLLKDEPLWLKAVLATLYYGGLRISEAIAITWLDINFKKSTLSINKQYYRYRLTSTKNYATREIEMPPDWIKIINELKESKNKGQSLVFTLSGSYLSANNIREHHFNPLMEKMEEKFKKPFAEMTPHCLRHTHASYLLSNGVPLIYVSKRLGHKDCQTTLREYNHVMENDYSKAMFLLQNIKTERKQSEVETNKVKT